MKKFSLLLFILFLISSCSNEAINDLPLLTYDSEIVIDASKDGGGWWYPQDVNCDSAISHQGKQLVDFLKQEGYSIYESCRQENIDLNYFPKIKLLIVVDSYYSYSDEESQMILNYVKAGGKLMLLLDHRPDNSLANKLGLDFQETNSSKVTIEFINHEITQNIESNYEISGVSGLNSYEHNNTIIARLNKETFLDTNSNGILDPGEITSPILIGTMEIEQGKVLFSGDVNIWLEKPEMFKNAIHWFELR